MATSGLLDALYTVGEAAVESKESDIRVLTEQAAGGGTDSVFFLKLQNSVAQYQLLTSTISSVTKTASDALQGIVQKIS